MSIIQSSFGCTTSGDAVSRFTCTNANGYSVDLIDYGATVVSFKAPDREGNVTNITLGCDTLQQYQDCTSYFGSTVGRYCNRINGGKFSIDGQRYSLEANDGQHHLHGGPTGFAHQIWQAQPIETADSVGVKFSISSPDGEGNYPGNLNVSVDYVLNQANELVIEFHADTDDATHVNLTNHSYWNLAGAGQGTIKDHLLTLASKELVEVNDDAIPTGQLKKIEGTVFDFREARLIGEGIEQTDTTPTGYDHCYVIDRGDAADDALVMAAQVYHQQSGRTMEVLSTQPGIQVYTGNWLDGQTGSGGFTKHAAFALESQHFPDSPNQPEFPSTLLRPDEHFHHKTIYRFGVK